MTNNMQKPENLVLKLDGGDSLPKSVCLHFESSG